VSPGIAGALGDGGTGSGALEAEKETKPTCPSQSAPSKLHHQTPISARYFINKIRATSFHALGRAVREL
jgi:hypothetical protein